MPFRLHAAELSDASGEADNVSELPDASHRPQAALVALNQLYRSIYVAPYSKQPRERLCCS